MTIALKFSIFLFVVLVFNQLISWVTSRQRKIKKRVKQVLAQPQKVLAVRVHVKRPKQLARWVEFFSLPGSMMSKSLLEKLRLNLMKAGIPLKAEEIVTIAIISGILTFGLGILLFKSIILGAVLGCLGLLVPGIWVSFTKHQRTAKLEGQLLDAIIMIASSLRAGHSFLQALELVNREVPAPLSEEVGKLIRETKMGIPLEEALTNLGKRVESNDMELVITGVLIQRQVGGNLAELLDGIAKTIDRRIKTRAKIKALTAQGKLSAWIVSLLPLALAIIVFGTNPEFGRIMLQEPLGKLMLLSGVVLLVLGIFIIRKVVNVDV